MDGARELLPPLLRDFADEIGEGGVAAAITLAERWPGVRRYIPASPEADHPISQAIGWEAAKALGRRWGGENPIIPRLDRYWRHIRDQQIFERLEARTATGTELALEFGLRSDTVYSIYAEIKGNRQQGDLFGGM